MYGLLPSVLVVTLAWSKLDASPLNPWSSGVDGKVGIAVALVTAQASLSRLYCSHAERTSLLL